MTPPSLPPEVFDALPPAVQAYIRYLEARLGQTSANSSKPPSSDPPHAKPAPPKTPSGKRRGGQPGHPKRTRPDLPTDTVIELRAGTCDRCGRGLAGDDPAPLRHQVIEIPPVRPHVTEYRRHRLPCPRCGRVPAHVMRTRYNAVGTGHLLDLMRAAGFAAAERLDGRFYRPVLIANREV